MPPAYVKPYVKRQKNDAADAEAICEAVTRANMRFVETKAPEQQACLMLHRTRHLFIRQQTSVINAIRAHLAEFGIVARVGRNGVTNALELLRAAHLRPTRQRLAMVRLLFEQGDRHVTAEQLYGEAVGPGVARDRLQYAAPVHRGRAAARGGGEFRPLLFRHQRQ
jgi:transposase